MAKARAPQQIALLYALIGCLWILFSDQLVALLWQEPQTVLLVSQLKGWGYVVVTALLFYWLIRRSTERLVASESELREHSAALASADSLLRSQLAEVEGSRQRLHVLNQQLQASHQLYSDLVNSIDGIVWELEIETFRFTFVSKKAEKLLGYPVDQWLNEADFWTNHLHPGDRTWAFDFCLQATQAKRNHTFEYRFLANDGRIIWLRDVVTVVVENDRPVKLRGVMLDVTEKKQADEALKAREILLNTVLDTLPVGVWIADRQGELIRANQAAEQFKLVGLNEDGQCKGWWVATGEPIKPDEWWGGRVLRDGQVSLNEMIEIESFDGQRKFMLHSAVPLYDEYHEVRGAVVVNQDVTELHRAEQEVRQLNAELEQRVAERTAELAAVNRELESFSYSVSHDLRAPLRHIDGFSRALLEDCLDQLDEKGRHHLNRILAATHYLGTLIDDLLQLARVSRHELWLHSLDLSGLARDISRTLQEGEPARCVAVEISDGLVVNADPRLMRVVLENLLGNAWKYTGLREQAEIVVGQLPETVPPIFFVRDNGVGFDMAFADKLFSPFQRLHHRDEFEGTGIGLATVKRILERHGGSIWAEAKEGVGATFYFTLDRRI